ncbi:Ger(x)C family spore germination protein [Rossellomorea oryzaecorticis]|uniref:Ger(X)C family spore germination protein n=1 Tax=Rossellomorea oryzaecorticis TaxID=1396505 RepID=A0ABU9K533_9BACI
MEYLWIEKRDETIMTGNKFLKVTVVIILTSFITGCWDSVEIQQRTMILSVALDKPESNNEEDRYDMTIQIAEPNALTEKPIPGTEPVWNLSTTCPSLFQCVRDNATEVARPSYYGHLQIILIGEELAMEEGIVDSLDLFFRDHEMRRRTKLIIVKGKAKDALETKHPLIPISGQYISDLTQEAVNKTALIPITFTVGQFSSEHESGADLLLPIVYVRGNHVDMSGGAIMREGKLIGFLTGEEVKLLRVVEGTFKKGAHISSSDKKNENEPSSTFEVKGMRSIIHTRIKNDKPEFKVEVLVEGHLAEDGFKGLISEKKIKKMENELNKKIKNDTLEFIKKMQDEYQADVFGFGEKLRRHEYKYWKNVKGNWEEAFAEAKIEMEVNTSIRRYGRIKK